MRLLTLMFFKFLYCCTLKKNESSDHGFVFQDLKWQEKIPILWECLILR